MKTNKKESIRGAKALGDASLEVTIMFLTPYTKKNELHNYNPFRAMEEMERAFFGGNGIAEFKTDIRDTGDAYVLEADLPGFKKDDINIELGDGNMTIRAERHSEAEEKGEGGYLRQERSYGAFSRSFSTEGVDVNAMQAKFNDGVLTLTMPKLTKKEPEVRRLAIE